LLPKVFLQSAKETFHTFRMMHTTMQTLLLLLLNKPWYELKESVKPGLPSTTVATHRVAKVPIPQSFTEISECGVDNNAVEIAP